MTEGAGLARQTGGIAVGADGGDDVRADALDRERARADLGTDLARNGFGFAGEDRLVEPERVRLRQVAVGDDLVAGAEPHEVTDDELYDRDRARPAAAD